MFSAGGLLSLAFIILVIIGVLSLLGGAYYVVQNKEAAIVERLGKFHRVSGPGLHFKIPVIDRVLPKRLSMKVEQLEDHIETKTKDNVFVTIPIAVQYAVIPGSEESAYYSLAEPEEQMKALIADAVRTPVAKMTLDKSYESKQEVAESVSESLTDKMGEYGYRIISTLVTDIQPDATVKASMNAINAAERNREAAKTNAEAEKEKVIKAAEAEARSKQLQGEGTAAQRKAIVEGLVQQHTLLKEAGVETNPEVLILFTQYLDSTVEISKNSNSSTIFQPTGGNAVESLMTDLKNTLISADSATKGL